MHSATPKKRVTFCKTPVTHMHPSTLNKKQTRAASAQQVAAKYMLLKKVSEKVKTKKKMQCFVAYGH